MPDLHTLRQAIEGEARCKAAGTCPRLRIRELFFEPNPYTIAAWRTNHGLFGNGIDRRVVFVCESPSDRRKREEEAHFTVEGVKGWICWDYTGQDRRFHRVRERFGFQNCLITNAVKCGLPRPSTPANLTADEAESCSSHLASELAAIRPIVVACMGGSALGIAIKHALPKLAFTPLPVLLNHYSQRGSLDALDSRWDSQFESIRSALKARGVSPDEPLWVPVV